MANQIFSIRVLFQLGIIIIPNAASPLQGLGFENVQAEDPQLEKVPIYFPQLNTTSYLELDGDYWPEVFPTYDQIDKVLTFVEGLKQGISQIDISNISYLILPESHSRGSVHGKPGHSPRRRPLSHHQAHLVKKHGETDADLDSWEDYDNYKKTSPDDSSSSEKYSEEDSEEDEEEEEETTTEAPTTTKVSVSKALDPITTTTQAPFKWADIQVPFSFLRIEYMIGMTFLGLMYGLGFLVLWQSILVPIAKFFVFISYLWAIYAGVIEPITKTDAMQYVPPTK
ncbi:unnamed protein product [Allacma fusca]|uniref:Uncharacterized protein n=1 Tax=Allacma fusca TaxID=39272 RepID=A0A8J2KED6_9HEXA|nr:unnamed protein product [Allacma fusca]